jgi:hypothetical protein
MPEDREIHLDELLADQSKVVTLATVEAIPDKPEIVSVTPWIPGHGCACQFALTIPKRAIGKLFSTEHRHNCCGKVLKVVEIEFREDSSLSVADIFADRSQQASALANNFATRSRYARPQHLQPRPRYFQSRFARQYAPRLRYIRPRLPIMMDPFDPGHPPPGGGGGDDFGQPDPAGGGPYYTSGGDLDLWIDCYADCIAAYGGHATAAQKNECDDWCTYQIATGGNG